MCVLRAILAAVTSDTRACVAFAVSPLDAEASTRPVDRARRGQGLKSALHPRVITPFFALATDTCTGMQGQGHDERGDEGVGAGPLRPSARSLVLRCNAGPCLLHRPVAHRPRASDRHLSLWRHLGLSARPRCLKRWIEPSTSDASPIRAHLGSDPLGLPRIKAAQKLALLRVAPPASAVKSVLALFWFAVAPRALQETKRKRYGSDAAIALAFAGRSARSAEGRVRRCMHTTAHAVRLTQSFARDHGSVRVAL